MHEITVSDKYMSVLVILDKIITDETEMLKEAYKAIGAEIIRRENNYKRNFNR